MFCTRLFVHLHIESKATIMICPECKSNVNDELKYCPECGAPLPKKKKQAADNGEPKLRRPMIIFIIVGTALLILLSILSYTNFSGQSGKAIAFDPDTTLLGKEKPAYDEMPSDSAKADSIDKAEKEEAKKVYNRSERKRLKRKRLMVLQQKVKALHPATRAKVHQNRKLSNPFLWLQPTNPKSNQSRIDALNHKLACETN